MTASAPDTGSERRMIGPCDHKDCPRIGLPQSCLSQTRDVGEFYANFKPGAAQSPDVRCQRCGSSGDTFVLCAGCQSPVTSTHTTSRPGPEVVAAVQEALMKHPFWKPGLGSSGFAFGLANTAIDAYLNAVSQTVRGQS